jgi:hypothetical protein
MAESIDLHPALHFYVHRSLRNKSEWTVTDQRTGMGFCHGKTRCEAIEKANELYLSLGLDVISDKVRSFPIAPLPENCDPFIAKGKIKRSDLGTIVSAIEKVIPLTENQRIAVLGALSPITGRLRSKRPQGMAGAAWQGMQPNPWKISVGAFMFTTDEGQGLTEKLSRYRWPACLDIDAHKLAEMGVW